MTDEHPVLGWMKEIQKVAKRAAVEWPEVVEEEDLVQDICVYILERPGTQRDLAAMGSGNRYQTLHKIGQRIASKTRNEYEQFSGNYQYSVGEVRKMLESARFDDPNTEIGSSWSVGGGSKQAGTHSDPTANAAIRNVRVSDAQKQLRAALSDLRASNDRQYESLVNRFVRGEIPSRNDPTKDVIQRALISVTTKMNHGHKREFFPVELLPGRTLVDGPGTRKAVSSSAARYISKESWDADYSPAPAHLRDGATEPEVWE